MSTVLDYNLERVHRAALDSLTLRVGANKPLSVYAPVLALTVTRQGTDGPEVLICVRDPQENLTHPNVLSSPTMRLRNCSAVRLAVDEGWDGARLARALREHVYLLMTDKLRVDRADLSAVLVRSAMVWQGDSVIGIRNSRVVVEHLTMVNVHVEVPVDWNTASSTASYSSIRWVTIGEHKTIVDSRDATSTGQQFDGAPPIVYGLCTQSTAAMLRTVCSELTLAAA